MPHEDCVNLIKRAGNTLALKVVTANMSTMTQSHYAASHSLPYRRRGKSKKKRKENNDQGYHLINLFQHLFVRFLTNRSVVGSSFQI